MSRSHHGDFGEGGSPSLVVSAVIDDVTTGDDHCSGFQTCGACTFARFGGLSYSSPSLEAKHSCQWCSLTSTCYSASKQPQGYCVDHHTNQSAGVAYEYDCPLGPVPYPDKPPTLLPNWMGEFYKAKLLDDLRLVDLSLPGSHDSLSYDLSQTVSADGIDSLKELAKLLHTLSGGLVKILPGDLEEFFRMQAKTQQLTLTQQLDNGIRFLDIRIMWEPDKNAWYSIHFMQSKKPAEEYLKEIRRWMDAHPQEVVVIWLSKHGSPSATGNDQYPGVSKEQKHQFWKKYCHIFDGMMQATNETSIFLTPLGTLIEKNHRVISYVSDYMEFSQNSELAENAVFIQNTYDDGDGVFQEEGLLQSHIDYFRNASINNAALNKHHGFTLLAMNTASPGWQVISAAKHQFLHWLQQHSDDDFLEQNKRLRGPQQQSQTQVQDALSLMVNASPLPEIVSDLSRQISSWVETSVTKAKEEAIDLHNSIFSSCTDHIKIPGMDHFCPNNLMDISQLSSYYNQIAIETAFKHCFDDDGDTRQVLAAFPNAFYLDGLDYDGTMRVGPQLLDGSERGDMNHNVKTKNAKYALVDTLLSYNARIACSKSDSHYCGDLMDRLYKRRSRHPIQLWSEPDMGRHHDWPPYSYDHPIRRTRLGIRVGSII